MDCTSTLLSLQCHTRLYNHTAVVTVQHWTVQSHCCLYSTTLDCTSTLLSLQCHTGLYNHTVVVTMAYRQLWLNPRYEFFLSPKCPRPGLRTTHSRIQCVSRAPSPGLSSWGVELTIYRPLHPIPRLRMTELVPYKPSRIKQRKNLNFTL